MSVVFFLSLLTSLMHAPVSQVAPIPIPFSYLLAISLEQSILTGISMPLVSPPLDI